MRVGAGGKLGLESLVGLAIIEPCDAIGPGLDLNQHGWQVAVRGRPRDQGDVGCALEDLFALLLSHAAKNGEALPFLVQLLEIRQPVEDLLLRLIADRAGVVNDEVGVLFALHLRITLGDERSHNLFGVVEVHLAAEGFDVKRCAAAARRWRPAAASSFRTSSWNRTRRLPASLPCLRSTC